MACWRVCGAGGDGDRGVRGRVGPALLVLVLGVAVVLILGVAGVLVLGVASVLVLGGAGVLVLGAAGEYASDLRLCRSGG